MVGTKKLNHFISSNPESFHSPINKIYQSEKAPIIGFSSLRALTLDKSSKKSTE